MLVVSQRQAPAGCAAHRNLTLVDRKVWRQSGAVALRRVGDGFETTLARPPGYNRPWVHTVPGPSAAAGARPAPGNPGEDESLADEEPERAD